MKRILFLFAFLIVFSINQAQAGIIYNNTVTPIIATNMEVDNVKNLKCGKVQIFHCLGLVDTGYAGIQNAAIRGKISKIHHVDVRTRTILGIGMTTVEVYGE
jgi:hypothetical protein